MPEETRYPLSMAPPSLVDYGHGAPSPKTAYRNSDTIDFRDVFGGPPRRTSVHEMRYSYTEGSDSFGVSDRRIGEMSFRDPWTGVEEKPVFGGGESTNRRRYLRGDFFDDIFKGNESPSSTPRNVFSSSPGSRALSPARPLPPRADGLGSPSLPSQLSLPDKLGRGMDSPTLGSTHSSYKDSASNGASSPHSPKTSVFGFSTRAVPAKEETRHANQASYRPSPLSQQLLESQESASTTKSSGESDDLKKGANSPGEVPQFHFSIYKWANKGIPLVTPLRRVNSMKLKRRSKTEVSSFTEGSETPTDVLEPVSAAVQSVDSFSNTSEPDTASFGTENWMPESSLASNSTLKDEVKASQIAKDEDVVADHDVLQSERGVAKSDTKVMKSDQILKDERRQEPEAARKPELKPLHSFIHSEDDEPGSGAYTTDGKTRGRESVQRSSKKSHENIAADKSFKKHDEELSVPKNEAATKVPSQEPPKDAHDSIGKRRAKGRVKEFIKIFNHEPPSKPKSSVSPQDQSSNKSKDGGTVEASQQANHQNGVNDKLNRPYVEVPQKKPDMVDRPPTQSQAEDPTRNTAKSSSNGTTSAQKNSPASRTESVPKSARVTTEEAEESSHTNFTIKELPQDENKQGQYAGDNEEIQAADAKIRQWSRGKEGNIRSLLSTLQYVLWPGNGWKPVPLVDIIEGPAVKRAYQKAMLCLHPDKLQQKGASSHQKYIAEKVFDILQEAWDHFNTLGGL